MFGSPHLALYRREALDETCARWGVGLGSAGPELRDDTKARMAEMGHGHYIVYDTAKIVNTLLQGDGHPLVHRDLPQLVHIGGLAHYLSPPGYRTTESGEVEPDWTRFEIMTARHEVTRYTARTLRAPPRRRARAAAPRGPRRGHGGQAPSRPPGGRRPRRALRQGLTSRIRRFGTVGPH